MSEEQESLVKIGPGSKCVEFVTGEVWRLGMGSGCMSQAASARYGWCREPTAVELRYFGEDGLKVTTRCYCRAHLPKRWRRLLKAAFGSA